MISSSRAERVVFRSVEGQVRGWWWVRAKKEGEPDIGPFDDEEKAYRALEESLQLKLGLEE